jgi:DNA-binding NarL/FixJ family response regulator
MKQDASNMVLDAIRRVHKGKIAVSDAVASMMLNRYAKGEEPEQDSPVSNLSDRELDVLNLIGEGVTTREIAQRLRVSVKTIESHRSHIKTKLNLETSTQLVQFSVRWVDENQKGANVAPSIGGDTAAAKGEATPKTE